MKSASDRTSFGPGIPHRVKPGRAALPAGIIRSIVDWFDAWREMRRIGELDEHLLRDIGLTEIHARGPILAKPVPKTRKEHPHG